MTKIDKDFTLKKPQQLLDEDAMALSTAMQDGQIYPVDPELAEYMGALEEDALDAEDAFESRFDHLDDEDDSDHDDEGSF